MFPCRTSAIVAALLLTSLLTVTTRAESDVEKYCKYLDCQKGKVKPGESFAATNYAFGYCTCSGDAAQKKLTRYVPCNFGETFSLEQQKCVKGVAKS